jgi:hypothetical protein
MRPSSAAFEKRPGESHASCYVESIMSDNKLSVADVMQGHEHLGCARITLATLRSHEFDAVPDPNGVNPARPHVCDVAHGALIEPPLSGSGLKKRAGRLAKDEAVEVVIKPPETP